MVLNDASNTMVERLWDGRGPYVSEALVHRRLVSAHGLDVS
jgi:hypothetical protein